MLKRLLLRLVRRLMVRGVQSRWRGRLPQDLTVRPLELPGPDAAVLPARCYRPAGAGPFPIMLFCHGGGFVVGNLDTHDPLCRELCQRNALIVVSVDYRLAPEHPFPAAARDAIAALNWLAKHAGSLDGDPERLLVGGDSAGGNLVAVAALQARAAWPGRLKAQILIYPTVDHYSSERASYSLYAKGHALTRRAMIRLWDHYLRDTAALDPRDARCALVAPLRLDTLQDLPPTLILTAEYDPLRDEGVAYADKLREAGVAVTHVHYPDQEHGFVGLAGPTAAHVEAMNALSHWLGGQNL